MNFSSSIARYKETLKSDITEVYSLVKCQCHLNVFELKKGLQHIFTFPNSDEVYKDIKINM